MVASQLFSEEDQRAITDAVRQAEMKTSAEIVPVVATTSDPYERAEDLVGLAAALITVSAAWTQIQRLRPPVDGTDGWEPLVHLLIVAGTFVWGWIIGLLFAKGIPGLKRLAASRGAMKARVLIAAHHAFDSLHADKTSGGTGVVIYVSMFERRVCVWADRAISATIPEAEWKAIAGKLTRALGDSKPREGFLEAIRKTGELLAASFPIKPSDANELSNELRILE
jgi:putative membrane protein